MSNDKAVSSVVSTFGSTPSGQTIDGTPGVVTYGNSVPVRLPQNTRLAGAEGQHGFLEGNGRIRLGPHAGLKMVDWAQKYAEHGWYVFPMRPGTKSFYGNCPRCTETNSHYDADAHAQGVDRCTVHPGGYAKCHGLYAATTDTDVIRAWWLEDPFANIGINCGRSGIVLVDIDVADGKQGEVSLAALEAAHGALPDGPSVLTASGGQHRLFRPPTGVTVRNSASALASGIDIKATGGLMIAAASLVVDKATKFVKGQYTWTSDPWQELPELPAWVLEEIERNRTRTPAPRSASSAPINTSNSLQDRITQLADGVAQAPDQRRNITLFENAVKCFEYALVPGQADADEIEFTFTQAAVHGAGLPESEVRATIASARRKAINPYTWRTRGNTRQEGQSVTMTAEDAAPVYGDIPEQRAEEPTGTFYSNPDAPMRVARDLEHMWTTTQGKTLHHWRETWMQWTGTHWTETGVSTIKSRLYLKLEDAVYLITSKKGTEVKPWNPNISKIANLVDAISAVTFLDQSVETGTWLGCDGEGDLISCRNVLVNPLSRVTYGHTPSYFTTTSVPYEYDPAAECPQWIAFLSEVFGDDTESIQALQEWAGYVLSGRTNLQKGIQLVGPPRAGKGTVARILEKLIGKENSTGTTLGDIGRQFGLAGLVGKSLCVIGDAHMENRSMASIVTRLLMIMGGDTITVDRKNRVEWEGKMGARIMMLANKPPKFSDASGAIVDRWITVKFTKSFLGKEDPHLEDRLTKELPGIFNWALEGLQRLTDRGWFVQPASGLETIRTQRENASPVNTFVEEHAVRGEAQWITKDAFFAAWRSWCLTNNVQAVGTTAQFATDLYAAFPGIGQGQKRISGKPVRVFTGITLRTDSGMIVPPSQSDGNQN